MVSPSPFGFVVSSSDLYAISGAIVVGYVLPTVLMSLPAPSVIGFEQKQMYMAIWQMFPLWVSLVQPVLAYAIRIIISQDGDKSPGKNPKSKSMGTLRGSYMGLLIIAGIGQIATATLIATSAFFPDLFSVEFIGVFNASKVFLPASISPFTKVPSIGSGALQFLQYDEAIGSLAMMIWSTVLFVNVYKNQGSRRIPGYLITQGAVAFILAGPLGYATACIWARDEMVAADLTAHVTGKVRGDVKKTS